MREKVKIQKIKAYEILDSRGYPTVEATVVLSDGSVGCAAVPSGASTGKYEAHELRDDDCDRFGGKGVLCAVENVNEVISKAMEGDGICQSSVDAKLCELDGTCDKSNLGANAVLAVSLANAKAAASHYSLPLYRYIGGIGAIRLPVPMMNILNGGAHAANSLDVQEFMIMPIGFSTFSEALRAGCEIYHSLGGILKKEGKNTSVGDEGGFAPDLADEEEALEYILKAVDAAGYDTEKVKIALDAASSEWYKDGVYRLPKSGREYTSNEMISHWHTLISSYPVVSVEDALGEDDHDGWKAATSHLGDKIKLVGDDLFVTNIEKLSEGIRNGEANAILIKPNQVGTLTEALRVTSLAGEYGYRRIISHRSGETADTTVADLAVGMNAGYIKTGAPSRSERTSKYNRLLKIESALKKDALYGECE